MNPAVTIELSPDEALVLSHMLARFERTDRLWLANNAEFVALSSVSRQLDKALVEPFLGNYAELVLAARERLAGDYEGLAPGVEPDEDDLR